jgi:FtsH-binding integral membrane protein
MQIPILVTIWFAGIAITGVALLFEDYSNYATIGTVGWAIVAASSGMIFYEIKRIRSEDKKKELI